MKKNKLGRGLEYLFEQNEIEMDLDNAKITEIILEEIKPNPFQPRKNFDQVKLQELSDSILEHGVFQPIIVRKGIINYEIISGERRYRASKIAGLKTIPTIIYELTDNQMMEIGIVENIQREDLSPIEEATAYQQMIDKINLTQEEIAQKTGKSRSYIANKLRLLSLDSNILEALQKGEISESHARRLVSVEDSAKRNKLLDEIKNNHLNVRDLEKSTTGQTKQTKNKASKTSEIVRVENQLREKFNTKVSITSPRKGKLEIYFETHDDLEQIVNKILEG